MTVFGLSALQAKLARLQAGADDIADEARGAFGEGIADDARAYAPVLTGELRDSIEVDSEGNVVATVEYAVPVELGTVDTPAQPFMRPAADVAERHLPEGIVLARLEIARRT